MIEVYFDATETLWSESEYKESKETLLGSTYGRFENSKKDSFILLDLMEQGISITEIQSFLTQTAASQDEFLKLSNLTSSNSRYELIYDLQLRAYRSGLDASAECHDIKVDNLHYEIEGWEERYLELKRVHSSRVEDFRVREEEFERERVERKRKWWQRKLASKKITRMGNDTLVSLEIDENINARSVDEHLTKKDGISSESMEAQAAVEIVERDISESRFKRVWNQCRTLFCRARRARP
jgi:hypothetical protein